MESKTLELRMFAEFDDVYETILESQAGDTRRL